MSDSSIGVPEAHPFGPAQGCPNPASLPQIQIYHLSGLQPLISSASHAPPPMPVSHSP